MHDISGPKGPSKTPCPICNLTAVRRKQTYCSAKCRKQASRRARVHIEGCGDLNAPATVSVTLALKSPNDFSGPKTVKAGWSDGIVGPREVIQAEIIACRKWQEVVSSDGVKSYVSRITKRALIGGAS